MRMRRLHNHRERTREQYHEARLQSLLEGEIRLRRNKIMQPPGREVPRLTGYLRAFGEVSSEVSREPVLVDETLLRRKQKRQQANSTLDKKWSELKEEILARSSRQNVQKVQSEIRNLHQAARDIVGGDVSTAAVDSAAVFLYTLFSSDPHWGRGQANEIRKTLGPFPASAANRACDSIKRVLTLSPPEQTEDKASSHSAGKPQIPGEASVMMKKEFGHNIVFSNSHFLERAPPGLSDGGRDGIEKATPTSTDAQYDSLSEDEDTKTDAFSAALLNGMASKGSPKAAKPRDEPSANSGRKDVVSMATGNGRASPYSGSWLAQRLQTCTIEGGMPWHDLYTSVFELLSSTQESAAIQNDLVELLGFSHLDLIQDLLTHRQEVVAAALEDTSLLLQRGKVKGQGLVSTQPTIPHQRPAIGSQVVIQSEEEKALRKQLRKEEKRLARGRKEGQVGDDHLAQLKALGFDPEELRRQREIALEEASFRPLLASSRPAHVPDPSTLYPHVYDSLTKAKLSAAFVAGAKVGIPEAAERKSDRIMEEIYIPHTSAPPPPVGEEKVWIRDLDNIAQLAFKGTKTLNRIQSIAFNVAYYTSENLLISAPTGAGKTNLAMLAVLREIGIHIEEGVIKKDQFKIIYVAPMKALAAEMVRNFGTRLAPLGIKVKELTGDMQLTKYEIKNTQMIVTTPEKWDVVTRKATGDVQLAQIVRLLIIDEIHLLHEDRGAVIESLVARTLRQVESSQQMIRIIGLSATLPNYLDVARFLHVNPYVGLFFFDGRFRPVPLSQTFVGVKTLNRLQQMKDMDEVCYDKVLHNIRRGHQVMVFVHARNATVRTATALRDFATSRGDLDHFQPEQTPRLGTAEKQVSKSRNKQLRDLFNDGFSIHHAGMLRVDRNLVERLFADGLIKVLVCTATLAWGINLPAHAVIIKGTQIYNAQKGSFIDLGILDVLQIFGRAGRPQYDTYGEGTIITSYDKLSHYLSLLTRQQPIESQLVGGLMDNLNAEIALGTVTTVDEAVQWLSYTFLHVRMRINPLVYGIPHNFREKDPTLELHMRDLVVSAARSLDRARMIRFIEHTGNLHATDLGRTASHFYIKTASIEKFNELLKPHMNDAEILAMVSKSEEFDQVKVREDELPELEEHLAGSCHLPVRGGVENSYGKVNILLQVYISREAVESFSLTSDLAYVAQNAGRIIRGLFEITLRRGWSVMAARLLTYCKSVDHQLWAFQHPLRQFGKQLPHEVLVKLEGKKTELHRLRDMSADEIGHMIHHPRMGQVVKKVLRGFPSLSLAATIQPITRTVLRVRLSVTPEFEWDDRLHGSTGEPWWLWVEDAENDTMYHSEYLLLQKKQVLSGEPQELVFTIPIFDPLPPQYFIRAISDRWLGAEATVAISFKHLILPEIHPPHTKLLDLHPLPVSALKNSSYEQLFSFSYFNPIQTQVFHTLYHSDASVLLGAPTGSGKTVAAELAIFRVFNNHPGGKSVYIAPLKALVRERVDDWKKRLEQRLGKRVVELTGDSSPDIRAIERADVIVTTPEKWDGISRSWQNRAYVQAVRLLVIDEIHLLGDERGPVLEVIVSRTNFIASHTEHRVRVVGLSTALANARDLADWLEIKQEGLFNFHPAVRPVQLEVHTHGFPGKHYCPRMATMNKPTYIAIQTHSPTKPVLVFVSSRRQTRLTAFDLMAYAADNPKQWLHMPESELETLLQTVHDPNLKHTLAFGIGLHHAGLQERDRKVTEQLFVNQKIQVLIATSTLAWGVNFPAHLVVVKGTEYFDGKTQRYVDYPITDVLQMMGRAGRPQYDDKGVAVILVHDIKKHFYKKFLYEPFPVESNLLQVLADHLNAEVVAGTISSKQDALDYLTWTYFFRRLIVNPSYYQLEEIKSTSINSYLSNIVEKALSALESSFCLELEEDDRTLHPLTLGCIASYYYLHHSTVKLFRERLHARCSFEELLQLLADAPEYAELPVRHNEDNMNASLAPKLPIPVRPQTLDSPHTKTHLLLQAHFSQTLLPIADYHTDTKSVLDQAIRILQAMIDIAASDGWLATTIRIMTLVQMCVQGHWLSDSSLLTLPYMDNNCILKLNDALVKSRSLRGRGLREITCLAELLMAVEADKDLVGQTLSRAMPRQDLKQLQGVLSQLPIVKVTWRLKSQDLDKPAEPVKPAPLSLREQNWVEVGTDQECVIVVELTRETLQGKNHHSRAHAPRFPKTKDEGWWVLIGEIDSGELVALKRLGFIRGRTRTTLAFSAPEEPCRKVYSLYLISDCYLGLDQQHEMCLNFVASAE